MRDQPEEPSRRGHDERDVVGVSELRELELLVQRRLGQDDDAELGEEVRGELLRVHRDRDVTVQTGQALDCGLCPVLAYVLLGQIELENQGQGRGSRWSRWSRRWNGAKRELLEEGRANGKQ